MEIFHSVEEDKLFCATGDQHAVDAWAASRRADPASLPCGGRQERTKQPPLVPPGQKLLHDLHTSQLSIWMWRRTGQKSPRQSHHSQREQHGHPVHLTSSCGESLVLQMRASKYSQTEPEQLCYRHILMLLVLFKQRSSRSQFLVQFQICNCSIPWECTCAGMVLLWSLPPGKPLQRWSGNACIPGML